MPIVEQSGTSQSINPDSQWIDPLSEREIEVLQLIATGLTNKDIADQLYLSLHTVKVHARNIYSKLAVKNRTQAVAQAKVLGIWRRTNNRLLLPNPRNNPLNNSFEV